MLKVEPFKKSRLKSTKIGCTNSFNLTFLFWSIRLLSKTFGAFENDLKLGTMYCRFKLVLIVRSFGLSWLASNVKISFPSTGRPGITISTPPSPKSANSIKKKGHVLIHNEKRFSLQQSHFVPIW